MPRAIAQDFKASLFFDGASARVANASVAKGASLTSAYSVELWFKMQPQSIANATLFSNGSSVSTNQLFRIMTDTTSNPRLLIQVRNDANISILASLGSTTKPVDGRWHHLVWTDNLGTCSLYIDGVLDATNFNYTPSGTLTLDQMALGTLYRTNSGALWAKGNLMGLRTYSSALSAADVATRFANGTISAVPSLIWSCQQGAGTTVPDDSGNGTTGTILTATFSSDTPSKARSFVGGNFVQNGSFEYAPPFVAATAVSGGTSQWIDGTTTGSGNALFGWNIASNTTAAGSAMFDANNANTGTYSLKMVCTTAHANGLVAQLHPLNVRTSATTPYMPKLQAGRSYTLTGYVTTSGISNTTGKGAAIRVIEDTESGYNNVQNFSAYVNGTTAKQQLSVTFTAAANTTRAEVCVGIFGETGTAWFDDITLTETVPVGRSVVQDFRASLSFNGTSTALTSPVVPATTGFSFGIWLKVPNSTNTRYIDWETALNTDGFSITSSGTGANTLTWNINGAAGNIKSIFATNFPVGQWVHVAATFTPSAQALYVNGVLASSSATAAAMTTATGQTLTFGKRSYSASYAAAQMAGIVWQNTATPWTQQEVIQIMNSIQKSGANAIHVLGEGAGPTALDTSGNGNNGTITVGTFSADVPSRKRQVVGGNMIKNGDFEYAPPFTAATVGSNVFVDGTSSGSATNNLFGWSAGNSGTGTVSFDSTISHSGNYSLKVSNNNTVSTIRSLITPTSNYSSLTATQCALYGIPALPNTAYTMTAWVKRNNTAAGLVPIQVIETNATGGNVFAYNVSAQSAGTQDWTLFTLNLTTSSTARYIWPLLKNDIAGNVSDVWFDEVSLQLTTPPTRTLVA